jgi:hypothetical protein
MLLATISISMPASAKELYRWVDEKGVTHYSDTKPEGIQVERRPIAADPVVSAPVEAAANPAEEAGKPSKPVKPQGTPEQCARAAANLAHLADAPEIRIDTNGDGIGEPLDAAGRQTEIDRNKAYIEEFCGGAATK